MQHDLTWYIALINRASYIKTYLGFLLKSAISKCNNFIKDQEAFALTYSVEA